MRQIQQEQLHTKSKTQRTKKGKKQRNNVKNRTMKAKKRHNERKNINNNNVHSQIQTAETTKQQTCFENMYAIWDICTIFFVFFLYLGVFSVVQAAYDVRLCSTQQRFY